MVLQIRPAHRRWAALGFLAVALAQLPGCGGGGATPDTGGSPLQPADAALVAAQPGDLAAYFKSRLPQGAGAEQTGTGGATAAIAAPPVGAAATFSGTPLQEQGVDEDDLLEMDDHMVYALHPAYVEGKVPVPARLTASRRQADGSLGDPQAATLNPDFTPHGMYLVNTAARLAVLSQKQLVRILPATPTIGTSSVLPVPYSPPVLSLDLFSLADANRPAASSRIEIDGAMVGSRMIGSVLYLVSSWTPSLARYPIPANATPAQVQAALAGLTAADLLPQIRVDGAQGAPLVSEADCFLQPANASPGLQLTTVTAFDLSTPGLRRASRCFVGGVDALYMSPANVYLTSSRQYWAGSDLAPTTFPRGARTDIHKFSLQGLQVNYRASGEVAGHLGWDPEKKPYRMSEYQGDLRVLSFTGQTGWTGGPVIVTAAPQQPPSPATLTVLREDAARRSLKAVATLPSAQRPAALGHTGEQVYAVHFAGPQAYLVTFRRVDPLFVLDLSNPADPRSVGELALPGYADYLFPLPAGKLLGVGHDASADGRLKGLLVALFDLADPSRPRVLASRTLGEAGSSSALDYSRHGINLFTQGSQVQVALPVRVNETVAGVTRPGYQGLARYVADTAAGTLAERTLVPATVFDGSAADVARFGRYDLAKERSIQAAAGAYYLTGGQVLFAP